MSCLFGQAAEACTQTPVAVRAVHADTAGLSPAHGVLGQVRERQGGDGGPGALRAKR
jgi:hypothetical protein